jgi:hypothetical protein
MDKLLTIINGTLTKIALLLNDQAKQAKQQQSDMAGSIDRLTAEMEKQKPPVVNVAAPTVTVPEITIPEIKAPVVNVTVPEIKLPTINVPKPEVTVNVPEIKLPPFPPPIVNVPAPIVNVPKEMEVNGFSLFSKAVLTALKSLKYSIFEEVDRQNPVPVILVKPDGSYLESLGGGSAPVVIGGGGSQQSPIFGYKLADIEDATTTYLGYLKDDGSWYITKLDLTVNSFRYAKGTADYSTNWTARASLTYDYYASVF